VALATLPSVARVYPDAVVLWLDAHADLNVPESSPTGLPGRHGAVRPGRAVAHRPSAPAWDLRRAVLCGGPGRRPGGARADRRGAACGTCRSTRRCPTRLAELVTGQRVYFHLDCDVLEPGIVPTDYTPCRAA